MKSFVRFPFPASLVVSSVVASVIASLTFGCAGPLPSASQAPAEEPADLVLFGQNIITVDPETAGATAVAVRDGKITAVGNRESIEAFVGNATRVVELGDRALTPGFIDAHGHLTMAMAYVDLLNASSPPVGPMETVNDIVEALSARISDLEIAPGEVVAGYGYDDSLLADARHPDRDDLDRASTEHPIVLIHVSGHLATANSMALELFGYHDGTPDPPGGVIRRRPGTQIPNGVLEETASSGPLYAQMGKKMSPQNFARQVFAAIQYNTQYGITTIQDGATSSEAVAGLRALAKQKPLPVDVAAYLVANAMPPEVTPNSVGYTPTYENGVRVAGIKFVLDGSPQGRTAWMTEPYTEGPPGADPHYVAYPIVEPAHYKSLAKKFIQARIPIIAHANGDAAIDLMIDGVADAVGDERPDHRSVTIHSQVTRKDQLDRMQDLRIVPSFFAAHCFFWGDWHRKSFGDHRALGISPLRSALDRGIDITIHNDAPVVPPHIMRLIEIAMTRETRSGFVLGKDERISFDEALYAVTQGAAYSYFEENTKGSITVGKQADLVVLAADPRTIPAEDVSEVAVLETIARGRTVYMAQEVIAD